MPKSYDQLDIFVSNPDCVRSLAKHLFTPGLAPEQKALQGGDSSGWLEQYKVVRCAREFWYWRYCYRRITNGGVTHKHVPKRKYEAIAYMIRARSPVADILAFIKRPPGL